MEVKDKVTIVNISQKVFFPSTNDVINKHAIEFHPAISWNYKKLGENKTEKNSIEFFKKPFNLYEQGISISTLCNYLGGDIKKDDFIVKKVFAKLKSYALQCADRVIADLCCHIILKTLNTKSDDEVIIYFIEKSASDKMLGRLGSLYLNLEKVIICFLSFEPEDMFTNIISSQTGKLNFDLHRLMTRESEEPLGPYPGSSDESLKQTFFYKPRVDANDKILPIRLDFFSQGLTEIQIEEKCRYVIENIFQTDTNERTFYRVLERNDSPVVLLPIGFIEAKKRWDRYKKTSRSEYEVFINTEINKQGD